MIDFHTHILPGMDDGSDGLKTSLSMLRTEARQGITTVLMTPHFYASENSPQTFLKRRQKAWEQLKPYIWPELPQVHLGAEVQYFEGICSVEDIRDLRIEGTNLLLLEMPFCHWPDRVVEDVLELSEWDDTRIVLAHIERYMAMQPKGIWKQLRERGILMQCNVSFFDGWRTRHKAMSMLSSGEIQFLGSDCHNMKTRRPNWDLLPDKARLLVQRGPEYKALRRQLSSIPEFEF